MPAISGTTVQRSYKDEATTLFGRIQGNGTSAPTVITTNGVSKGIKSVSRSGVGAYSIVLDDNIPVYVFLGAVCSIAIEGTTVAYFRITSATPSNKTIAIVTYNGSGTATDITTSDYLNCTITYTSSPVW